MFVYFIITVVVVVVAFVCVSSCWPPGMSPGVSMVCEDALLNAERTCACSHKVLPGVSTHNRLKYPDKIQSVKWQGQSCSCSATDPETWSQGMGEQKRGKERRDRG